MVFLFVLLGIIILIVILVFSKIRIEVENLKISTNASTIVNNDYIIKAKFCILGIIPIFKIDITKSKLEKLRMKEKAQELEVKLIENKNQFDKEAFRKIVLIGKNININLRKFILKMEIGTEDAGATAIIIALVSTIISMYLNGKVENFNMQNFRFNVNPIYINKNLINIQFLGIFEVKMLHIINIIYILIRKMGEDKNNERTSDRRSDDYSYE